MCSPDTSINASGKTLFGQDGLSWTQLVGPVDEPEQLVERENELRFALESVKGKRTRSLPHLDSNQQVDDPVGQKRRTIEESLHDTVQDIRASGPLLATWMKRGHRTSQLHSKLAKFFKESVCKGVHKLKPMEGAEWKDNARQTMLWLISKNASPAHALLVLCSFSSNKLEALTFEYITYIVDYVIQNQQQLCCEVLERKVREFAAGKHLLRQDRQLVCC